jgi:hypothetical protein
VTTIGSGRPTDARVAGDPNQDDNSSNDRLPGYGRNAFLGPDYASMDVRVTKKVLLRERYRLEFMAESFNLFNRDNKRYDLTDDGFLNSAGQFVPFDRKAGNTYYPAYYQQPTTFLRATGAFAPRQIQLAMRLLF